jgi:hypothetical protein
MTKEHTLKLTAAVAIGDDSLKKARRAHPQLTHVLTGLAEKPAQVEDMEPGDPRVERALRESVAEAMRGVAANAKPR